jgi:hypothetical protein
LTLRLTATATATWPWAAHRHSFVSIAPALEELASALLHPRVDDLQLRQRVQGSGALHGSAARDGVGATCL